MELHGRCFVMVSAGRSTSRLAVKVESSREIYVHLCHTNSVLRDSRRVSSHRVTRDHIHTFIMQAVEAAIGELKKAASEGKRDKRNQAIVGRIADYLLLLVGCLSSPRPVIDFDLGRSYRNHHHLPLNLSRS
jgi:hypothetical protein